MGIRQDHAEAVTSTSSSPHCVQCGRPVVHTHKCPATPRTSQLQGPPSGWRDEVEAERRSCQLDHDESWHEELLPLEPITPPDGPCTPPP